VHCVKGVNLLKTKSSSLFLAVSNPLNKMFFCGPCTVATQSLMDRYIICYFFLDGFFTISFLSSSTMRTLFKIALCCIALFIREVAAGGGHGKPAKIGNGVSRAVTTAS
jgi:hypothetical protein